MVLVSIGAVLLQDGKESLAGTAFRQVLSLFPSLPRGAAPTMSRWVLTERVRHGNQQALELLQENATDLAFSHLSPALAPASSRADDVDDDNGGGVPGAKGGKAGRHSSPGTSSELARSAREKLFNALARALRGLLVQHALAFTCPLHVLAAQSVARPARARMPICLVSACCAVLVWHVRQRSRR